MNIHVQFPIQFPEVHDTHSEPLGQCFPDLGQESPVASLHTVVTVRYVLCFRNVGMGNRTLLMGNYELRGEISR